MTGTVRQALTRPGNNQNTQKTTAPARTAPRAAVRAPKQSKPHPESQTATEPAREWLQQPTARTSAAKSPPQVTSPEPALWTIRSVLYTPTPSGRMNGIRRMPQSGVLPRLHEGPQRAEPVVDGGLRDLRRGIRGVSTLGGLHKDSGLHTRPRVVRE